MAEAAVATPPNAGPRLRPVPMQVLLLCGRPYEQFCVGKEKRDMLVDQGGKAVSVTKVRMKLIQANRHVLYVDERFMNNQYMKVREGDEPEYDVVAQNGIREMEGYGSYFIEAIRTKGTPVGAPSLMELLDNNDKRFDAFCNLCIERGTTSDARRPISMREIRHIIQQEQKRYDAKGGGVK